MTCASLQSAQLFSLLFTSFTVYSSLEQFLQTWSAEVVWNFNNIIWRLLVNHYCRRKASSLTSFSIVTSQPLLKWFFFEINWAVILHVCELLHLLAWNCIVAVLNFLPFAFITKMLMATVAALLSRTNYLLEHKHFGAPIHFPSVSHLGLRAVSGLYFSDAGKRNGHGQLSYLAGLLDGPFDAGFLLYTRNWMILKSKRSVKSICTVEISCSLRNHWWKKFLKSAISSLLVNFIRLITALDSGNLFTSLSTQRNSVDKSMRADIILICYEYGTR